MNENQTADNELLQDWQLRVIVERNELDDKIARLALFLSSSQYKQLPAPEQDRLTRQHLYMVCYSNILYERVIAWGRSEALHELTNPLIWSITS